jgi:hypothetical protein
MKNRPLGRFFYARRLGCPGTVKLPLAGQDYALHGRLAQSDQSIKTLNKNNFHD